MKAMVLGEEYFPVWELTPEAEAVADGYAPEEWDFIEVPIELVTEFQVWKAQHERLNARIKALFKQQLPGRFIYD